eukprot:5754128-Pleurochrysis_carterae.AAC.1
MTPAKSVFEREGARKTESPAAMLARSDGDGSAMTVPRMRLVTSLRSRYVTSSLVATTSPRRWPERHITFSNVTPMKSSCTNDGPHRRLPTLVRSCSSQMVTSILWRNGCCRRGAKECLPYTFTWVRIKPPRAERSCFVEGTGTFQRLRTRMTASGYASAEVGFAVALSLPRICVWALRRNAANRAARTSGDARASVGAMTWSKLRMPENSVQRRQAASSFFSVAGAAQFVAADVSAWLRRCR